jgi:rhodanese-related sulfurtransferase
MLNLIRSADACAALRSGGFHPYVHLGPAADDQITDGVRFIGLRPGEQMSIPGEGQRISVLAGRIETASDRAVLDAERTRQHPYPVPHGGTGLRALTEALLAVADGEFLDLLISWEELERGAGGVAGVVGQRLSRLHRAVAFRRLPLECVESALARMTPRRVSAGEDIVRQGEPGDAFYVIWEGRAEVWQAGPYDDAPRKVAERGSGDSFGDDALITGGSRSATVRMITDGELLVLAREDFLDLMSRPLVEQVDPTVAGSMLDTGWRAVDVRYPEEFEDGHIPGATLLPLHELRERCDRVLSRTQAYVAVCLSGKRSAVAALLLTQRGFKAVSLKNGLRDWNRELASGEA